MDDGDGRLTDEQLENWRRILFASIGPYALMAPREQIQRLRDDMQALALEVEAANEEGDDADV